MNFFYEFLIPKNTPQIKPYQVELMLTYGVIVNSTIDIPAGHTGTAHLQMLFHGTQIYPLNNDGNYHGNKTQIPIIDRLFLDTTPYSLILVGWNTDPDNDHRFLININILLPDQVGMNTGYSTPSEVQDIVGTTVEV